ncbi:unnamed protein product [Cunninghamella blakesleeana]
MLKIHLLFLITLIITVTLVTSSPLPKGRRKSNNNKNDRKKQLAKDILNIADSIADYFEGDGTFYEVGKGSCGKQNTNNDMIVALNDPQMKNGSNPNKNPECNKKVQITGENGKTVEATIEDTCPSCSKGNLDMSPKVFQLVCGNLDKGRCRIKWKFSQ